MTGRIDVHSHLLPGVDDGCQSVEESIACARRLVAAGYAHCFCTPHIWPNLPKNTVESIPRWTAALQAELDRAKVPLKLHPGGEIHLREDLATTVPPEQLVTYNMNRRHVLIDLWSDRMPGHFEPAVRWLQSLGLTVILAHPERMRMIQNDPDLADVLAGWGVLLQGNLQCLGDPPEAPTRQVAERYLLENRYFLLGSDTHRLDTLDCRLLGLSRATELAGTAAIDQLTITNPATLL